MSEVARLGSTVVRDSPTAASTARARAPEPDASYDPGPIEAGWQARWKELRVFAAPSPVAGGGPACVLASSPATSGGARMGQLRGYAIADACARFLRARGRAVLFSSPFATSAHLSGQLERLGCSCDWESSSVSSDPEHYSRTQRLFLLMLERDLVYRPEAQWLMRVAAYVQETERELEQLSGWSRAATASQRAVLGRVDGVELDASTFDGAGLTVFTSHPEAIADSAFIAVSPDHPDSHRWSSGSHLATVAGVAGLLPIVVSPLVDARFGPTAVLGIPKLDPDDRSIAEHLAEPSGATWKASKSGAQPRPAVRYRAGDLPVSRPRAGGAPIPVIHCSACGIVPVPSEDLPLPEGLELECPCPRCQGSAARDPDTIDGRVEEMWVWLADHARWLPVAQIVSGTAEAERVFEQRVMAKVLQDVEQLPPLPGREPFAKALVHDTVQFERARPSADSGDGVDPDAVMGQVGSDALRLTLLYAAAPERLLNWNDAAVRYCGGFLEKLYAYAEPRLGEWGLGIEGEAHIDTDTRLRRRLANWCGVAHRKATGHLERLEAHRAADDAIRLLARIQDFEQRSLQRCDGDLEDADREAIVAALLLLVRLLAPLTPHLAEELWSLAGHDTLVSEAPWPEQPAHVAALHAAAADGGDA